MTIAQDKFSYMVALNHFGSEAHESSRKVFLQQIVGRAEAIFDAGPLRDQKPGSTFQHYLDGPVERLSKQLQLIQQHLHPSADVDAPVFVAFDDYAAWPEKFIHSIRRAWAHITELKTRLSAKDCKEEGSNETLGEECTTQASSKPYIACFWLLLISSSTSAATRDQPGTYRSDQNQIRPVSLPVFIASSFDVLCSGSQAVHHASEVATKSYISMMGRPLWASLFDESFWAVAVRTLLGSDSFNRCSDISCFNVLATRLALDFVQATINDDGPIRNQVEFAGKSVDVHMRILDKLDNHAVLHIRAPSEPVLAIAASLLMMPTREDTIPDARSEGMPKTRYGCILQVVGGRCLTSTNIDVLRDNRGGLATKLVLMTAWDAAKQVGNSFKRLEDIEKQASHLLQPVLLDAIIDGLIKLEGNQAADIRVSIQSICEKVRTQCPDHANAQAWAHHTHFDVLKDPVRDLSPEYLWYCWKRGVAIQMAPDQLGVDGIIPIFVGDLTRPFANLTTQQMDTDAARGAEGDETWAACHMTYIAWKGEAQSSSEDFETALRNPVTAGPLLRYARIQDDALTRRGILTVWTDLSAKDKPAKLDVVADADKPMLLIQGVAQKEPRNYPCLDTLRIRSVATRFIKDVVSGRKDYEKQNRMHDPVSLRTLDAALAGEPGDAEETCAPVDLDIIFRPLVGDTPDESTPSEPMEPGDLRL
ncbi:hypothetical protein PSEUBRA_005609 [Kalmanozyma brasiliensis GHG001]|uniref:uncharacterized protein n=1 Tax=Kalmanozyma brasiliensis (strain GHG001) TaxID=1365824 RepID=UPI002867D52F|nr:uncharacterized protein PSEUBRA_005609 [Kalmanozyma brasiliensis GHG001]KAF6767535.1 hypothetical protein PSEUBRA_005609 [Kalmanozyma brasiliensis GHG001]